VKPNADKLLGFTSFNPTYAVADVMPSPKNIIRNCNKQAAHSETTPRNHTHAFESIPPPYFFFRVFPKPFVILSSFIICWHFYCFDKLIIVSRHDAPLVGNLYILTNRRKK
jgi:hypothetical protein